MGPEPRETRDVERAVAMLASRTPPAPLDPTAVMQRGRRIAARHRATIATVVVAAAIAVAVAVGSTITLTRNHPHATGHAPARSQPGSSVNVTDRAPKTVAVAVVSADEAWKCLDPLQYTSDGGRTWHVIGAPGANVAPASGSLCAAVAGGNAWAVVATGNGSVGIERVRNATVMGTVPFAHLPASTTIQSIDFIDARHGWIATGTPNPLGPTSENLYRTGNGGTSWSLIARNIGVDDVQFTSPSRGWALAPASDLVTTTDGGKSWHRVTLPAAPNGTFIGQVVANAHAVVLWRGAAFPDGSVRSLFDVSTDAHTWSQRSGPPGLRLQNAAPLSFAAVDANHWRFLAGPLWTTDDGGRTWSARPEPPVASVESMSFPTPDTAWLSGSPGGSSSPVVLRTVDGGRTWTDLTSARPVAAAAGPGGIIGCPKQPITAAPAGNPPPGLVTAAIHGASAGSLWASASVAAVYRVGNLSGGTFGEAIVNNVSSCGTTPAASSWVVELHHPSGAQLSAVVLAHYASGWHVFGSYP